MTFIIPVLLATICVLVGGYIAKRDDDKEVAFTCGFLSGVGVVCCVVVLVSNLWR